MVYREFGKTGWRVSQVGVGCWQFGGAITVDGKPDGWPDVSDEESAATIQRAVELGVNFFDTSDMYGWGRSEEVLGRTLKKIGHPDRLHIATKVGFWHDDQGRRTFNESKAYILRACDASLRRLQVDHIDLYQCHLWRTERWPEFLDAFEELQQQGKIGFYGVSTNDFDIVDRFDERKKLGAVQSRYSLLSRKAEREMIPYCRARGIAFIARTPLAQGRLSGRMTKDYKFGTDDIRSKWLEDGEREKFERDLDAVDRLKPIAEKYDLTMAELAMKFVVTNPVVSTTIPGARNREQLEQNVAAGLLSPLTHEELAAIDHVLMQPSH
jgi:aryl-alcohol dehydrogenase-like predicted oxidoreductase